MSEPLRPEDYEEPNCVLCDPAVRCRLKESRSSGYPPDWMS